MIRVLATGVQRGLWLTQALDPASPAYLIAHAFELDGPVDADALAAAADDIVERHESLRASFEWVDDDLVMVVDPAVRAQLRVEDLTTGDPDAALTAALDAESTTPFDLHRAPLIRFRLLRLGDEHHVLILVVHHIVADGVSVEVLWREFAVAYQARRDGAEVVFPHPAARFTDLAVRERERIGTGEHQRTLDYWRERLRGAPTGIALPDRGGVRGPTWRGGTLVRWLSEAETDAVLAFSRARRVTPYLALLTVFSGVLHRWTGQADVVVGSPVTLRDQEGFAEVVGMMANTVALRTSWEDDPTADDALDRTLTAVAEALAHRWVAFDHVVAALPELREPGRGPVVQVLFGYEAATGTGGPRLAGIETRRLPLPVATAKFELSLDCALVEGRLMCGYEWGEQRLDAPLVGEFADHFEAAVRFVVGRPEARVGEWPLSADQVMGGRAVEAPLPVGWARR